MFSDAVTVLDELAALHAEVVFPSVFDGKLTWSNVASFECAVQRTDGEVTLKSTTFWLSPDRDPNGMMRLEFETTQGKELGKCITNDKLTIATGNDNNLSVILGFSPTLKQARKRVESSVEAQAFKSALIAPVSRRKTRRRR